MERYHIILILQTGNSEARHCGKTQNLPANALGYSEGQLLFSVFKGCAQELFGLYGRKEKEIESG